MIINGMLDIYKGIITIEQGKRSGKPCIRNMRISVEDKLCWTSRWIVLRFSELDLVQFTALAFFAATLLSEP
jgi:uncharacterized protein (DUF433 family)